MRVYVPLLEFNQCRTVRQAIVEFIHGLDVQAYISLGPGDAEADLELIRKMKLKVPSIEYIPVDISHGLLQHAISKLRNEARVPIGILGDFEEGFHVIQRELYKYAGVPRLFGLLGNTLGNLDIYEQRFLDCLASYMGRNDRLLVEIFTKGRAWSWERDATTQHKSYNEAARRFIAKGIECRTGFPSIEVVNNFEDHVAFKEGASDIPKPGAVCIDVTNHRSGRKLISIRKYVFNTFSEWIKQNTALEIVKSREIPEPGEVRGMGVFLLKRKPW